MPDPIRTKATFASFRREEAALTHLQNAIRAGADWDESHYAAATEIVAVVQRLREERDALLRYVGIDHISALPGGHV
jgi:hypothetical protein